MGENWQVVAESTVTETFTVWAANADEAARLVAENRAGDPDTVTEPAVRAVLTVRQSEAFVPDCPVCRDSGVIVERYDAGDGSTTNVDPCGECPAGERIARERLELRAAAERGSR